MPDYWHGNFGMYLLPDDFPKQSLTKSGWFDGRRNITADVRKYVDELEDSAMKGTFDGKAPRFAEWQSKKS